MKKLSIIFSLFILLIAGCGEQKKYKYIKTERGLLSFGAGYCELGMLTNNDRINIRDENDKPITCSGYINLTKIEKSQYEAY